MGPRPNAAIVSNVEVKFAQFLNSYLGDDEASKARREALFWDFIENDVLGEGRLDIKLVETRVVGGLGTAEEGLEELRVGRGGSGKRVVRCDLDCLGIWIVR